MVAASLVTWQQCTEAQLVARSQQGDKDAFGELVRRYQRLVVGIAYRMSGDAMLAEDASQDAFLRAWQRLDRFECRSAGSFRAWLCRIATNITVDRLRKARPTVPLEALPLPGGVRPDEAHLRSEETQAVRAAVLRLPAASRAALPNRSSGSFLRHLSMIASSSSSVRLRTSIPLMSTISSSTSRSFLSACDS